MSSAKSITTCSIQQKRAHAHTYSVHYLDILLQLLLYYLVQYTCHTVPPQSFESSKIMADINLGGDSSVVAWNWSGLHSDTQFHPLGPSPVFLNQLLEGGMLRPIC